MTRFDDEMLMAFVDGEIDEVNRARIERAMEADPALRDRIDGQRRLRERLAAHYGPIADDPVPERFRELLSRQSGVVRLDAAHARRPRPAWRSFAALAATLVLGIAIGQVAPLSDSGPIRHKDGALIASGDLSRVLDSRLASQQGAGEETRVGISFARSDGGVCRTFQSPAIEGLACREGDGWRMVMIGEGGAQTSEYRMAGSGSAAILAAAQEMMAGEPLDAEAERRARDAGWRISAPAD